MKKALFFLFTLSTTVSVAQQTPTLEETKEWILTKLKVYLLGPDTDICGWKTNQIGFDDANHLFVIRGKSTYMDDNRIQFLSRDIEYIVDLSKINNINEIENSLEFISDGSGTFATEIIHSQEIFNSSNGTTQTKSRESSSNSTRFSIYFNSRQLVARMKNAFLDMKKHYGGVTRKEKY